MAPEKSSKDNKRRSISSMNAFGSNNINLKSPFIAMFWSFAFPGFGHFYINNYLLGMLLILWELIINTFSRINLSIYYSILGSFEMAKNVANTKWFIGYGAIYIFCMWDSYQKAIEQNKQFLLVFNETRNIQVFNINLLGVNYLSKRNPWISLTWAFFMPGLYAIYSQRIIQAVFGTFSLGYVSYKANFFQGILFSAWGQFDKVKETVDPQWFLFLPSMYGFILYQAFAQITELNKLFKNEQTTFLRENYQSIEFKMPI